MGPYQSPSESPEPSSQPALRQELFTAVFIPTGAIAGIILLFAVLTTEILVIPGFTPKHSETTVSLLDIQLGSTDNVHQYIWGIGFLATFVAVGSAIGYVAGKGLDRLSHWRT